jgi:signal transduction histidine kinase
MMTIFSGGRFLKRGFSRWREGGLLLCLVRGLALVLALVLYYIFYNSDSFIVHSSLVIGVVAVYTVGRIIYPYNWYGRNYASYLLVASDIIICCALPFATGGFNSPFILYPITAILSASLFFPKKTTYIIVAIVSVSVVGSELVSRFLFDINILLPVQFYIALMVMYIIVGFLIAWLPYMANINLYNTIKERAIVEERSRLSRELHDGPAQRLAALTLKLELLGNTIRDSDSAAAMSQITGLKNELKAAHIEVRETIDQLRLKITENTGILAALAEYTREFSRGSGIPCHVYLADGHTELNPLATTEMLRVAQEALTNVRKHSSAGHVEVRFESRANLVTMIIKDDGHGFKMNSVSGHHGLVVMQERVESLGGKLEIISSPGAGTEIRVTVPSTGNSPGGKFG